MKSLNGRNIITPPVTSELNNLRAKAELGKQCEDKKKGTGTGKKKGNVKNTKYKQ